MESRAWLLVGTFFGAGLAPKAPGTVGSVASLALWAPMALWDVPWWARLLVAAVLFALGTAAAQHLVRTRGEDPQIVVMDEVVGVGLTTLLSSSWASVLCGLVCFRIFDIAKPWPVSWADRRVKGGFGVMLDDVVAAGYAAALLAVVEHFVFPLLARPNGGA